MRRGTKALVWIMVILLILLIGVIAWLALHDSSSITEQELGNTVIGEMAEGADTLQETQTEEETQAPEQPTAPAVANLPNEKEVGIYTGGGGVMNLIESSFDSVWDINEDIATFEAINSDEPVINYDDYYTLHSDYWYAVDTDVTYKIGYELSFDADGEHKVYTILGPADITQNADLYMGDYPYDENGQLITGNISGLIGVWVYQDIGQEGYYTHLIPEEVTDDTIVTSIKLRPTLHTGEISNLKLKAFSYTSDEEFDAQGHYIGTHGYEISINNIG